MIPRKTIKTPVVFIATGSFYLKFMKTLYSGVNKDFLPVIEDKIGAKKPSLFGQKDTIETIYQNNAKINSKSHAKAINNNDTTMNQIPSRNFNKTLAGKEI